MKIHPEEAEFFHGDRRTGRRTDMTKIIVAFRRFANASKSVIISRTAYWQGRTNSGLRDRCGGGVW